MSVHCTMGLDACTYCRALLSARVLPRFNSVPLGCVSSTSMCTFSRGLGRRKLSPHAVGGLLVLFRDVLHCNRGRKCLGLSRLRFQCPGVGADPFRLVSRRRLAGLVAILSTRSSRFSVNVLLYVCAKVHINRLDNVH